jgi:carboxyl-terminal processing protease
MKRILKSLILTLTFTITSIGYGQNINYIYIKDIPQTTNYIADFTKISDKVNDKYTHLKAKNIDGASFQAEYLALVKNAKTNIEYGDILVRYFASLRNSHANAIFKKYYKECSASLIENRIFLSYVDDSLLIKNGVKEKDEILKVNRIPVLTYIQNQTKYTSASTDLHRTYLAVSGLFSSYLEEDRTYTIKTATGEKDITVHFDGVPAPETGKSTNTVAGKIESKVLKDTVAYIAILSMTGDVVNEFVKAFDTLSQKQFLIIDLRRNQGGNSGYSEKIAEYLISKKQVACVSNRQLTPKGNRFMGKLFVLTSPYTVSAAESFVIDLSESGSATLVGMPTAGDTGNQPAFYQSELGYTYWFPSRKKAQISAKGFPMEGKSVMPQYAVARTVTDYLADRDTVLEYVLKLINRS